MQVLVGIILNRFRRANAKEALHATDPVVHLKLAFLVTSSRTEIVQLIASMV